ncbi:MAG TPA: alkaline phosphatase family protein, partial [Actinomycetota bacterium]|nr:alkaline phosphatase family protein [Actinomycetota bacterium]
MGRRATLPLLPCLLAVCALVAAACLGAGAEAERPPSGPIDTDTHPEGPKPARVDVERFETRWPIKRVVFIIKENRSFDHMFGRFPGANGVTFGYDDGVRRPLTPAETGRAEDIPHCYNCALASIAGGRMDGFNQTEAADRYAYTQFRPWQLPNYWHWAEEYVLSDNFFASATGPSFPNHLYTIA